jgi:hypothetical protein
VTKLLFVLMIAAGLAGGLAPKPQPPLLIDSQPSPSALDANR